MANFNRSANNSRIFAVVDELPEDEKPGAVDGAGDSLPTRTTPTTSPRVVAPFMLAGMRARARVIDRPSVVTDAHPAERAHYGSMPVYRHAEFAVHMGGDNLQMQQPAEQQPEQKQPPTLAARWNTARMEHQDPPQHSEEVYPDTMAQIEERLRYWRFHHGMDIARDEGSPQRPMLTTPPAPPPTPSFSVPSSTQIDSVNLYACLAAAQAERSRLDAEAVDDFNASMSSSTGTMTSVGSNTSKRGCSELPRSLNASTSQGSQTLNAFSYKPKPKNSKLNDSQPAGVNPKKDSKSFKCIASLTGGHDCSCLQLSRDARALGANGKLSASSPCLTASQSMGTEHAAGPNILTRTASADGTRNFEACPFTAGMNLTNGSILSGSADSPSESNRPSDPNTVGVSNFHELNFYANAGYSLYRPHYWCNAIGHCCNDSSNANHAILGCPYAPNVRDSLLALLSNNSSNSDSGSATGTGTASASASGGTAGASASGGSTNDSGNGNSNINSDSVSVNDDNATFMAPVLQALASWKQFATVAEYNLMVANSALEALYRQPQYAQMRQLYHGYLSQAAGNMNATEASSSNISLASGTATAGTTGSYSKESSPERKPTATSTSTSATSEKATGTPQRTGDINVTNPRLEKKEGDSSEDLKH